MVHTWTCSESPFHAYTLYTLLSSSLNTSSSTVCNLKRCKAYYHHTPNTLVSYTLFSSPIQQQHVAVTPCICIGFYLIPIFMDSFIHKHHTCTDQKAGLSAARQPKINLLNLTHHHSTFTRPSFDLLTYCRTPHVLLTSELARNLQSISHSIKNKAFTSSSIITSHPDHQSANWPWNQSRPRICFHNGPCSTTTDLYMIWLAKDKNFDTQDSHVVPHHGTN